MKKTQVVTYYFSSTIKGRFHLTIPLIITELESQYVTFF